MHSEDKYILRLYIAGITISNQDAILEFKRMLKDKLGNSYNLEVIDIFERPELAEGEKIVATPTAVKHVPGAVKKVILDFNNKQKLLMGIDILIQ